MKAYVCLEIVQSRRARGAMDILWLAEIWWLKLHDSSQPWTDFWHMQNFPLISTYRSTLLVQQWMNISETSMCWLLSKRVWHLASLQRPLRATISQTFLKYEVQKLRPWSVEFSRRKRTQQNPFNYSKWKERKNGTLFLFLFLKFYSILFCFSSDILSTVKVHESCMSGNLPKSLSAPNQRRSESNQYLT